VLRVRSKEQAAREGVPNALLAGIVSDQILDSMLAAKFGPLTPGRCLGLVLQNEPIIPPSR
jgi:hypothetical protein